jgi:hypothetical protein
LGILRVFTRSHQPINFQLLIGKEPPRFNHAVANVRQHKLIILEHACLPSFSDLLDMLRPSLQRLSHLFRVGSAIIDSSDASAMPTYVVQDRFDNVGQGAQLSHPRGCGAPEIMKPPPHQASPRIERCFGVIPSPHTFHSSRPAIVRAGKRLVRHHVLRVNSRAASKIKQRGRGWTRANTNPKNGEAVVTLKR